MSTLSQFYGGSPIKSIQRGTVSTNRNTVNVTISSVNVNKTVLNYLGTDGTSSLAMLRLINSNTLRASSNSFGAITTSYEVIEYN